MPLYAESEFFPNKEAVTIPLQGGLDLVTSKVEINPGTLQECLNYEVGREQGYTRAKGLFEFVGRSYTEYTDGIYSGFLSQSPLPPGYGLLSGGEYTTSQGDRLKVLKSGEDGIGTILFAILSGKERASYNLDAAGPWSSATLSDVTALSFTSVDDYIADIDAINEEITSRPPESVSQLVDRVHLGDRVPGTGPILSIFELEGSIYAVRGSHKKATIPFDSAGSSFKTNVTDKIAAAEFPDIYVYHYDGVDTLDYHSKATVISIEESNDDYGGDNGAGTLELEVVRTEYFNSDWDSLLDTTVSGSDELYITTAAPGSGTSAHADIIGDIYSIDENFARLWKSSNLSNEAMQLTGPAFEFDDAYWTEVDTGRELQFDGGEVEPVTALGEAFIEDIQNDLKETDYVFSDAQESVSTTSIQFGWNSISNVEEDDGNVAAVVVNTIEFTPVVGQWYNTALLKLTNFGLEVPSNAAVVGIEVEIEHRRAGSESNWSSRDSHVKLLGTSGGFNKASYNTLPDSGSSFRVDTYGGANDTWGVSNLSREVLTSEDFGVEIRYQVGASGVVTDSSPGVHVDYVKLRIHYYDGTSHVYFYDTSESTDVAEGDIVHYFVQEGDWDTDDAEGVMTVYDITDASAISPGLEIRNAASGAGAVLALTSSSADKTTLPSILELNNQNSRYQTVKSNFYSDESADAIYGATGVGRAFMFNGKYFVWIRTGVVEEKDKPRHVAEHQLHLVLGYKSGQILTSVVGDPLNFSGVDGASEFGFGDSVTGLMPLEGTALGVFCKDSTHALVGTTLNNFSTQIISKSSGCIEYSLSNLSQPIYCDYRGISNVSATTTYGDFAWGRLSEAVSPWLEHRLNPSSIVDSVAVRGKNQYRVYFSDGYILTMTLYGIAEQSPMFTIQHYDTTNLSSDYVPSCIKSFVRNNGQESILMGTSNGKIYSVDGANGILDRSGRSGMDHYITLNPFNAGAPHLNIKYRKATIHGKFPGASTLVGSIGTNYLVPDPGTKEDELIVGNYSDPINFDLIPDKDSFHLGVLTDGYSLKIASDSTDGNLGHTLQALTLRFAPTSDKNFATRQR